MCRTLARNDNNILFQETNIKQAHKANTRATTQI